MAARLPAPGEPCTAKTLRCPSARSMSEKTNDCCRAHVDGMLKALHDVFEDAGVRYWMDYGTLLGALRNKGMVPHDKDGDICVRMKGGWDRAVKAVQALEEKYHIRVNTNRYSFKVRVSRENKTNVDVFFWWRREDGVLYRRKYARVDRNKGKSFPEEWVEKRVLVPYADFELWAPEQYEKLIIWRYGENWRTPVAANNDGIKRGEWVRGMDIKTEGFEVDVIRRAE